MYLGKCKEDTSCTSAPVRRHIKTQHTPYHPSFSDRLQGRRPDVAEVASYEMLKELGTPESPKWVTMASARASDLPTRNKIGLHTNSYYKKSHPFGRHKSYAPNKDVNYLSRGLPKPPKRKKENLLRQFNKLSNHYNSMRKLISEGLGEYGMYGYDEDIDDKRSPSKRRNNIYDYDQDLRLGMDEQDKDSLLFSYLSPQQPWIG